MWEIAIILLLLLANGVFAMTEIALVSARKARLRQLADEGSTGATQALKLLDNPERFLSTVQVGITLVGVLSGAYGGVALSGKLEPWLARIPLLAEHASQLAFAIVVSMALLSRLAGPVVSLLEASTRVFVRILGGAATSSAGPTREEVQVLVREGIITGMVNADESEMVEGVFDLREVLAEEIMRPKPKVLFLRVNETIEQIWSRVAASRQTVFPVHEGSRDEIRGLVSLHDLFACAASGRTRPLAEMMIPPVFVSENQPALSLMNTLRASPLGAALVVDEFGTIRGLITLEDLVEEIVGELRPRDPQHDAAKLRPSGENTWIVDGLMEIDEVVSHLPELEEIIEKEREPFQTLAGYIVHRLDRLPAEGETFTAGGFEFEVVDMDRQRIDKVLIRRLPPPAESPDGETAGAAPA